MIVGVADTHAAIWYIYNDSRLSARARSSLVQAAADGHEIAVSAITLAEVVYLEEKGRVATGTLAGLVGVLRSTTIHLTEVPVTYEIVQAMSHVPRAAVPDMPDRIIAATALHLSVPLISRDRRILLSAVPTIW